MCKELRKLRFYIHNLIWEMNIFSCNFCMQLTYFLVTNGEKGAITPEKESVFGH